MKPVLIAILFFGLQFSTIGQVTESNSPHIKSSSEPEKTTNSYTPPEFPGGEVGLFNYFSKKTKYPKELKNSGVKGMVYVAFLITETGEIPKDSIRITQSLHPLLDEEAINVISKMPNWEPAIDKDGNPIKIWFKLPVRFK